MQLAGDGLHSLGGYRGRTADKASQDEVEESPRSREVGLEKDSGEKRPHDRVEKHAFDARCAQCGLG
jgi:hypothetical protein